MAAYGTWQPGLDIHFQYKAFVVNHLRRSDLLFIYKYCGIREEVVVFALLYCVTVVKHSLNSQSTSV